VTQGPSTFINTITSTGNIVQNGHTNVETTTQNCQITSSATVTAATCTLTSGSSNNINTRMNMYEGSQVTHVPVTITAGAEKLAQATHTGAAAKTQIGMGNVTRMLALLLLPTVFTLWL
jgi:hypothetical protein